MKCENCGHQNLDGARFCASCGTVLPVQSEASENKLIGQVVGGRFRVTGVLGEGGMGVVYVGEQQMGSTIRKVAIKTLHPHLSQDPAVLARFHRECGTVAQLEHPNTIKVYDFGAMPDGTLYIAMEFVAGKALNKVIEAGPLPPDRAVNIMRQVCGALEEAHKLGIIHRDLKPENIVLTDRAGESDFVKVLDFGIAARTESADAQKEQKLTQQGMVLGTPPYMSPEQFTGKPLDARSDLYSLGVMVYEMLAGRLPFEADTPWQWATQHMTAQPTPFEIAAPKALVPEPMRHAIMRSLAKDRDARQASAREFFAELSGGDRMTLERAAKGTTGTANMPQAPDFSAGATAPTAAVPVVAGIAPTAPGAGHPYHSPPAVAAHVPPPPPAAPAKGGKGLIIGLGAVGALLLIAIAVVAARSMKPDDDDVQPITVTVPATPPSATTTIEPEATAQPTPPDPEPTPSAEPPKSAGSGGRSSSSGSGGQKPPAGEPCDACLSAARAGNIQGAASAFSRCSDAAKKAQCRSQAQARASSAALTAARNGDCARARGIVSAAQAMGASVSSGVLSSTSCK